MARRWLLREPDPHASRALAERLSLSPIAGQVLWNRGVRDPGGAARFLAPELKHLHDPFLFKEMRAAAERVRAAIERGEKILVHGDYDVDGTTGTAILVRLLRLLGADVEGFIPDRLRDGYGLKPARIAAAAAAGQRLVIAVDNGTTAFAAAAEAQRAGIDLIVADHHELATEEDGRPRVPEVLALLNPNAPGEAYPFRGLCGCAIAFKLAWAIAQVLSPGARVSPEMRELLLDSLSLVAIGTIADVVPIVDENRPLVKFGLKALKATRCPGLRALLEVSRIDGAPGPEDIGFRLAPRLNAGGRMGQPALGLDLLTTSDEAAARGMARLLDEENRRRQALERRTLEEALPRAEAALDGTGGRAIVVAAQGWHLGVVGIVASRLVERFHRPAVVIALDGERGRGSARSVPGIALHEAFAACRDELIAFGGHAAAAGLEIRADRVERFRARLGAALEATAAAAPPGEEAPLAIDARVELRHCSRALVEELARLEPHGRENEPPLFAAEGLALASAPRLVGRNREHLSVLVRQGETVLKAIGFGLGRAAVELERAAGAGPLAAAFRPIVNRWQGAATVELELRDVRSRPEAAESGAACGSWR